MKNTYFYIATLIFKKLDSTLALLLHIEVDDLLLLLALVLFLLFRCL